MNIVQSFSLFESGNPYTKESDPKKKCLNFYTFLLSYLTLKKYYGQVTMYTNQAAYDLFMKYIPYDNVVMKENERSFSEWNYYKVDVIREQTNDFIHVDSDVFIFSNLLDPFIKNG